MSTKIIPVIHYVDDRQAFLNAERALERGCHGVALIDMDHQDADLFNVAERIKEHYPTKLVGINHLSLDASLAVNFNIEHNLDFTWTDEQLTYSHWSWRTKEKAKEENLQLGQVIKENNHQLFIGVGFKQQRTEPFPWAAADRALELGFTPTTSGVDTGRPADPAYIKDLCVRMTIEGPLAIASGITPDNVNQYIPLVTHVFVATGISSNFYHFDEDKIERLVKAVL